MTTRTDDRPLAEASDDDLFDSLRDSPEATSEPAPADPSDTPPDKSRKTRKRKAATTARKSTTTTRKAPTDRQIKDQLSGTLGAIGSSLILFDPWCGVTILDGADRLTDALIELSKTNPSVRRTLEAFAVTSSWGTVFGAVGAVALPVLAHHSQLIPNDLGILLGPDRDKLAKVLGSDENADAVIERVRAKGQPTPEPKPEPVKPTVPDPFGTIEP